MADTSRPLGSSSPDFSRKAFQNGKLGNSDELHQEDSRPLSPSAMFSNSQFPPAGTFLIKRKEKPVSVEVASLFRGQGPRIGKEISGKILSPEEKKMETEKETLFRRLSTLSTKQEFVFDLLNSSGVGDSYENIADVKDSMAERMTLLQASIKTANPETLALFKKDVAKEEDILKDIYRNTLEEITSLKKVTGQEKAVEETTKADDTELLRKELGAKNKVNSLLTKAMPLYGKFETLTQKVEALTQGEKTEGIQKEIKTVSALFDTFKLNPTEEVFEALTTFVNEKENQITSLFLDELQQKEKNKIVEAPVKTSENTAPQMKKIDQVPAESKPGEAVEKPEEETLSGKQTVMRPAVKKTTILLRQKKGENKSIEERTVPVEEWVKDVRSKEALKKETSDIAETRKVYRARGGQMLSIHKNMFLSNPEKYMKVYGNKKSWVEGDLNKDAFLHAPKDALDELAQERSTVLHDIAEMEVKIMSNGSDEEDRLLAPKIAELKNREASLAQKMQRYSNLTLQEKTAEINQEEAPKFSTIQQYKEVYKPNAISEKPTPNTSPKGFLSRLMNGGRRIKEEPVHQNSFTKKQVEGLVRLNDVEKVEKSPEGQLTQNHAIENNPKEVVTHKEVARVEPVFIKEEKPVIQKEVTPAEPVVTTFTNPDTIAPQENQQEKEKRSRSVADLFKKITTGKGLRSFIFAIALGTGAGLGQASQNERTKTIQTLEQGISFKDYLSPEDKSFLNDFIGSKDSGFEKIMEKYVPSLPLDKANPSRLATLSDAECLKLLNFPGTVYGYSEDQRKEICFVIRREENIIKANDIKNKGRPELSNSPYVYSNELMTVRGLFEEARRAAEQAINNEATITRKI